MRARAMIVVCMSASVWVGCGGVENDPPLDVVQPPPAILDFAAAPETMKEDRVSPLDDGVTPDGAPDGVFDATVVGPILRLALVTTDELGGPSSGQAYDTITGDEPMPTSIPTWFERGSDTWVLGVVRDGELLNRADGSVPELEAGTHSIALHGTSIGLFGSGLYWQLWVELEDGSWLHSKLEEY